VLHETLMSPRAVEASLVSGAHIRVHSDGVRSRLPLAEKFGRDAAVLQNALQAEPDNARYAFYLAQSLRDAGRWSEAIAAYDRRVAMGGWHEEVYYSRLQAAVLRERSGAPYADVLAAYFDAIECDPGRAEAYCDLARHLRSNGRNELARKFAQIASTRALPRDVLILDSTVYDWRARDELAFAEYNCGDRPESARLWRALLAEAQLPEAERTRIQRNLAALATATP
jgi:cytochrome c-type biogenesis protein CcmH/NrfG